ncbi:thioredoxin fold domain-containing protein [Marinobacter goseongensis]|uniref:thioredoxin fold domain-containing protein n=1 Tax=Marinobacter goseongensis TaxID=453838 RepID=UPI0020066FF1|nr:thioredoxin fold domain-containing protein [Marinobacter goseongensis]MCK7553390.1 thioredoxin fold domain-containing protein [Marinobacter goseongensis]
MGHFRTLSSTCALLGSLLLGFTSSNALAQDADIVELPIKGPLKMIMTDAGTAVIVSSDGRFVLPGQFVDRADDGQVVGSIEQARALYGQAGHNNPITEIKPVERGYEDQQPEYMRDDGMPNASELLSFSIGTGPKEVFVFVDPECPYCHKVVRMQAELGDQYTFHNLLVPLLGATSQSVVADMACMSESDRKESFLSQSMSGRKTQSCEELSRQNVERLAMDLSIEAVPTIIAPYGGMVSGAPRSVNQLVGFLESKQ